MKRIIINTKVDAEIANAEFLEKYTKFKQCSKLITARSLLNFHKLEWTQHFSKTKKQVSALSRDVLQHIEAVDKDFESEIL